MEILAGDVSHIFGQIDEARYYAFLQTFHLRIACILGKRTTDADEILELNMPKYLKNPGSSTFPSTFAYPVFDQSSGYAGIESLAHSLNCTVYCVQLDRMFLEDREALKDNIRHRLQHFHQVLVR